MSKPISTSQVEIILFLRKVGKSITTISSSLGITHSQVLQAISRQTTTSKGFVDYFAKSSNEFRCVHSGKLMISPMIAPNKQMYDQSSIVAIKQRFTKGKFIEVPKQKERITAFSKLTLRHIEANLDQISEDELFIAAECLSVLNIDTELESFLRVLTHFNKDTLNCTLAKLRELAPATMLQDLLTQLVDFEEFQLISISLVRELLLQPLHDFNPVFGCLFRILRSTELLPETLEIVNEQKVQMNSIQLLQAIEALTLHREGETTQLIVDELKLHMAYKSAKDKATFLCLLKNCHLSSKITEEVENLLKDTGLKEVRFNKAAIISFLACVESNKYMPRYTYNFLENTGNLCITDLKTGICSVKVLPSFIFKKFCSWCPIPPNSLAITGGLNSKEFHSIDTFREYSVISKPQMNTVRYLHSSVYHKGLLYVICGLLSSSVLGCERYSFAENTWQAIPCLPIAASCSGLMVFEGTKSLYTFGCSQEKCGIVQVLHLESLAWQVVHLKLTGFVSVGMPIFKVSERECFFVLKRKLYSFTPTTLKVKRIKSLSDNIRSSRGPSYYSQGFLYSSDDCDRQKNCLEIGELFR